MALRGLCDGVFDTLYVELWSEGDAAKRYKNARARRGCSLLCGAVRFYRLGLMRRRWGKGILRTRGYLTLAAEISATRFAPCGNSTIVLFADECSTNRDLCS